MSKYKDDRFGTTNYGQGVRYGKFAVISVCCALFSAERDAYKNTKNHVLQVLANWLDFEKYAIGRPMNYLYFRVYTEEESSITTQELNFEGYYKGRTLNKDIRGFFFAEQDLE
ncbi:hypothetical protein DQ405_026850 [Pseudomonas sp. SST3]|nr:hypothetical protein [Pseudomonas sp. SST3]